MEAFTLVGKLVLDSSAFTSDLQSMITGGGATGAVAKGTALGNVMGQAVRRAFTFAVNTGKEIVQTGMNFDAMMSQVKAAKPAMTEAEYNALREKAVELGRTTKFTAEEVASAFYYEAIAGWDVNKMLDGVKGTLDLAAASGEKLGLTSDIVTDSLTAFGLQAKDSGRFVDVLAAAAGNSNTNVQMMGESFKYLAPMAGTMAFSIEDVAVGLGLIANNGIKSTMAGTALRNILSTLVKPTDEAKTALKQLGISLDDGTGKIKPFREVMMDLREAFKNSGYDPKTGRSIEEIAAAEEKYAEAVEDANKMKESGAIKDKEYAARVDAAKKEFEDYVGFNTKFLGQLAEIGGLRGISALLAIMKSTDEDFNQLIDAVDQSEGAADKMAKTRLDNLQGDITLLNSALDGLKIIISDKFNSQLREGTQTITGWVTTLSDLIQNGTGDIIERTERQEQNAINDANAKATQAKGILTYMDDLVAKFGNAATKTNDWKSALSELEKILPDIGTVIKGAGDDAKAATEAIDEYIKAQRKQAIEDAKKATIGKYRENYAESQVKLGQAQIDQEIARYQMHEAAQSMAEYVEKTYADAYGKLIENVQKDQDMTAGEKSEEIARLYQEYNDRNLKTAAELMRGYEGGYFSMADIVNAAKAAGNFAGDYNQSGIDSIMSMFNEAQASYNENAAKISELSSTSENLKAQLAVAEAAYARMTGQADAFSTAELNSAAAGAVGGLNHLESEAYSFHAPSMGGGETPAFQAVGGWDIPYDNYLTRLHRGEMVLNATQARKFREGNYDSGASAAEIGAAMSRAMRNVGFYFNDREVARTFGNSTTGRVNRNIVQANRRHHAGYGG